MVSNCITGVNIVQIPNHVEKSFELADIPLTTVTPKFVRNFIRKAKFERPDEVTMALLAYCLSDKNYSDMAGIQLVPLANGGFGIFRSKTFYISPSLPQELLYGIKSVTIDVTKLPKHVMHVLTSEAAMQKLGLIDLSPQEFASLLPAVLPKSWANKSAVQWDTNIISPEWIRQFWMYYSSTDVKYIQHFPLLPAGDYLVGFEEQPKILASVPSDTLGQILKKLGCYELDTANFTLPLNSKSFIKYILPGNAAGKIGML